MKLVISMSMVMVMLVVILKLKLRLMVGGGVRKRKGNGAMLVGWPAAGGQLGTYSCWCGQQNKLLDFHYKLKPTAHTTPNSATVDWSTPKHGLERESLSGKGAPRQGSCTQELDPVNCTCRAVVRLRHTECRCNNAIMMIDKARRRNSLL